MTATGPELGVCQWFHYEDYQSVERTVALLKDLGIAHLRTGISWADFHRPRGKNWCDWQMRQLRDFDVLLSIWHTPPSISEGNHCASPPRRLQDYADFVAQVNEDYGEFFQHLELWNEPNNRYKWDFHKYDPQWRKFGTMVRSAAATARRHHKTTVLGGMIPVDHHWLELMRSYGVLEHIDVVAIHGFPEMWWPDQPNWDWYGDWEGWQQKIAYIARYAQRPIWVTETGLATWEFENSCEGRWALQADMLERAANAPAERVYWYSLIDLDPQREAIEGFHVDENEYHMGLVKADLSKKNAYFRMKDLSEKRRPTARPPRPSRRPPRDRVARTNS